MKKVITGSCLFVEFLFVFLDGVDRANIMTGLVANYEFEGDFSDFSGNGHNGVANSNPLIIEGREKGIAAAPGGDNSYIFEFDNKNLKMILSHKP